MGKFLKTVGKLYFGFCVVLFAVKAVLAVFCKKGATKQPRNAYSITVPDDKEHKAAPYLEVEPLPLTAANAIRRTERALQQAGLVALLGKVKGALVKCMGAM